MFKELDLRSRFGEKRYGGLYSSESLVAVLSEVETAFLRPGPTPSFMAELEGLLRAFAGRPTPLMFAKRLSEKHGTPIFLKREDLWSGCRGRPRLRYTIVGIRAPGRRESTTTTRSDCPTPDTPARSTADQ
jgi:hypothetical protein